MSWDIFLPTAFCKSTKIDCPECGGSNFKENIEIYFPVYTTSYPKTEVPYFIPFDYFTNG